MYELYWFESLWSPWGPIGVLHRSLFVLLGSLWVFLEWSLYAHQGSLLTSQIVEDGVVGGEEMNFSTNSGLSVNGLLLLLCLLFGLLLRLLGLLESPHTPSGSISLGESGSWPLSGGPMSSIQENFGFLLRRGSSLESRPGSSWSGKPPAAQSATEAQ